LIFPFKFKSAVFNISQGAGVRVISGDKTGYYAYTDEMIQEKLLRAGVASTGNTLGGGFAWLPDIGPHNTYIAAGTMKPEPFDNAPDLPHQIASNRRRVAPLTCFDFS
jgi:hypothetical protein